MFYRNFNKYNDLSFYDETISNWNLEKGDYFLCWKCFK